MTDKNDDMTAEQAAEFVASLTEEQLEVMRHYYYQQLAQAAQVAVVTLGPTTVAECHEAVSAELLITEHGRDFFLEHLDSFRMKIEKIDDYRAERRQ